MATERQYNIIRNLTGKVNKMHDKLDDFKAQIGNNEEALKVVHNKHMEVVKQIKLLIVTYDKLKANSKIIKQQIKDLKHRKKDLEDDIKKIKTNVDLTLKKLMERDIQLAKQFSRLNRRNDGYRKIIKKMNKYEKEIKELVPEDLEQLKNAVTNRFEVLLTDVQYTKKSLYTKSKRLEKINNNLNNIREILSQYSKVNNEMPNMINDVRKEEKVRKDAFFKEIVE